MLFVPNRAINRGWPAGSRAPWWTLPWITGAWDGSIGVTVTGSGVSAWAPVKGTNSGTQGTDAKRPTYSGGVLTFDGSNDALGFGTFTLNQPAIFFLAMQQISWTANDYFMDGGTDSSTVIEQRATGVSPEIGIYAGSRAGADTGLAVGSFGILVAGFNGADSVLQTNLNSPATINPGSQNAGGITLGANAPQTAAFAHFALKGFCYANTALTAAQINQTVQAMARRYGISV